MEPEYYAGIMTGSSFDGVDAVMTAISGGRITVLAHVFSPYDETLREDLLKLQDGPSSDELATAKLLALRVSDRCSETFGELLSLPEIRGLPVTACGVHGQTVRHNPDRGHTTQLADWGRMAETMGVDVVGDFRSQDVALKGQGAPIIPAFHKEIFGHDGEVRCALNIGGIANVTRLDPERPVEGFDVGPGNTLMDRVATTFFDRPYDMDGKIAAGGKVDEAMLARLLEHPFFTREPPKSAGRDDFPMEWFLSCAGGDLPPENAMRTALELTVATIARSALSIRPAPRLVVAHGGGCNNVFLMGRLAESLQTVELKSSAEFGIDPQVVESACIAWYAYKRCHGLATDLRSVTGQTRPCVMGARWRVARRGDLDPFGREPSGTGGSGGTGETDGSGGTGGTANNIIKLR